MFRVMSDREKGNELIERLSHVAYDRTVFDAAREEQKNNFKGYNSIEKAASGKTYSFSASSGSFIA